MDMTKTLEKMNKGYGTNSEIHVYTNEINTTVILLVKYFKRKKFTIQLEVLNKNLNLHFENHLEIELEEIIILLQKDIDKYASKTK